MELTFLAPACIPNQYCQEAFDAGPDTQYVAACSVDGAEPVPPEPENPKDMAYLWTEEILSGKSGILTAFMEDRTSFFFEMLWILVIAFDFAFGWEFAYFIV